MDLLFRNIIKVNSIYILTFLIISTTEGLHNKTLEAIKLLSDDLKEGLHNKTLEAIKLLSDDLKEGSSTSEAGLTTNGLQNITLEAMKLLSDDLKGLHNKTLEAIKLLSDNLKDETFCRNVLINSDQRKLDKLILLGSWILGILIMFGLVYILKKVFKKYGSPRTILIGLFHKICRNKKRKLWHMENDCIQKDLSNSRSTENEQLENNPQNLKLYSPTDSLMSNSKYTENEQLDNIDQGLIKDKSNDLLITQSGNMLMPESGNISPNLKVFTATDSLI